MLAGGRFQLMTTPVFAGVAVFCSILVVWFGFETRNLCDKLSPDEYMQATPRGRNRIACHVHGTTYEHGIEHSLSPDEYCRGKASIRRVIRRQ